MKLQIPYVLLVQKLKDAQEAAAIDPDILMFVPAGILVELLQATKQAIDSQRKDVPFPTFPITH